MSNAENAMAGGAGLLVRDEDTIDRILADVLFALDRNDVVHALIWVRDAARRLAHHLRAEEEVLFPALAARAALTETVRELMRQHQNLELILEDVEHDLLTEQRPLPRALVLELRAALGRHAADEERLLAEHADALPPGLRNTVLLLLGGRDTSSKREPT